MFFIIISALHVSGGFSRQSSGTYKTLCAALGIVMDGLELTVPTHPHQRQTAGKHDNTQGYTYSFISS
jgi:hypothetical protein